MDSGKKISSPFTDILNMPKENFIDTEIDAGFDKNTDEWEFIIKYSGDIKKIIEDLEIKAEILDDSYAIVLAPREKIKILADFNEIEYIEQAKLLGIVDRGAMLSSCISPVKNNLGLTGKNVLVGIIDTGLNIKLKDFIDDNNSSRVLFYWDQTIETEDKNKIPDGFINGFEYSREDLDFLIKNDLDFKSNDFDGHGTFIANIACGNGKTNENVIGVAPEANLIIVKLNNNRALTTQLMRGIKYCCDKAKKLKKPIVINISFGTNNGAHDGKSLFESYINQVAQENINSIVVATGNEGISGHHYKNKIKQGEFIDVEFLVSGGINALFLTLWKSFVDKFFIEIIAPNGITTGKIINLSQKEFLLDNVKIYIFYGEPTPYNFDQEIYFQFVSLDKNKNLSEGDWVIKIYGEKIVDGEFNIWLPINEVVTSQTRFLNPSLDITLTLPSTAENVISVGGYDFNLNSSANFSGRGYTRNNLIKPDLVAPAVDILVLNSFGDLEKNSGTSLAAPFVTGSVALMMEWGIINKNDVYLYGQKVKAYLRLGAKRKNNIVYPNNIWGYGSLCLEQTFDELQKNKFDTGKNIFVTQNNNENQEENPVLSEDYFEMIIKYNDYVGDLLKKSSYIKSCAVLFNSYVIINIPVEKINDFLSNVYPKIIAEWPEILALLDRKNLDAAGITAVQNNYLNLRGSGVLIGFIDTGIDYTKKNFIYEDDTSKIIYIWDQTIQGNPPKDFCYGTEFNNQEINNALKSENPFEIVPHRDEIGHGTFLASIAASRESGESIGAAPDSDLIIVKLKPAKNNIRREKLISEDAIAYQASDVLTGIEYLYRKSVELERPIAICIGLGTNDGSHFGESIFEEYITGIAKQKGIVLCIASGNEGNAAHHVQGKLLNTGDKEEIEINVGENNKGFLLQVWNFPPNKISLSVISPTGEYVDRIPARNNFYITIKLGLENTFIGIGYESFKNSEISQQAFIKFINPTAGIWKIILYGDIISDGMYYAWLPVTGLIDQDTFFLDASSEATITSPATASGIISVGAYDTSNNNLYISGSRGPKQIYKTAPAFVAPGVNVFDGEKIMSGTSVSCAIATGAAALLLEWGIVKSNLPSMNTIMAWSYLIQGCVQQSGFNYPNNQWGYGKLNLLNTFESLKLAPVNINNN